MIHSIMMNRFTTTTRAATTRAATAATARAASVSVSSSLRRRNHMFSSEALSSMPLPTRHSRHLPPAACLDGIQLKETTEQILGSKPGELFQFQMRRRNYSSNNNNNNNNNNMDMDTDGSSIRAWDVADYTVQKVEWLIRGHSASVEGTMMNQLYSDINIHNDINIDIDTDTDTAVSNIRQLLERLEQEGDLYMNLRHQTRSNMMLRSDQQQQNDNDDDDDNVTQNNDIISSSSSSSDLNNDHDENFTVGHPFAAPGPTTAMFDVLFDTMSLSPRPDYPQIAGDTLIKTVLERFHQDGGLATNDNPFTIPTIMTFNAVLRTIANTHNNDNDNDNNSERLRDDCLRHALVTYEAFRHVPLQRNAATYKYMLWVFGNVIPPSRSLGNIARTMWMSAEEDEVIDDGIMDAMRRVYAKNNDANANADDLVNFNKFMEETIGEKQAIDIPHQWRRQAKSKLYTPDNSTY